MVCGLLLSLLTYVLNSELSSASIFTTDVASQEKNLSAMFDVMNQYKVRPVAQIDVDDDAGRADAVFPEMDRVPQDADDGHS